MGRGERTLAYAAMERAPNTTEISRGDLHLRAGTTYLKLLQARLASLPLFFQVLFAEYCIHRTTHTRSLIGIPTMHFALDTFAIRVV